MPDNISSVFRLLPTDKYLWGPTKYMTRHGFCPYDMKAILGLINEGPPCQENIYGIQLGPRFSGSD